jgi:[acyl-carrier-protein] S-malonyltransferase
VSGSTTAKVAAWVGDTPVTEAAVAERLRRLRSGPRAGALPAEGTSESRQMRRWLAQVLVVEALVDVEAARLGVVPDPTDPAVLSGPLAALEVGSVVAAAVTSSPLAAALSRHVTASVRVDDQQVRRYYDRNRDRYPGQGFAEVAGQIAAELTEAARRRAFVAWLDTRRAALVHLEPGYEHPADPRQPDATHRH